MSFPEAAVVRSLKRHLLSSGLGDQIVSRILVDADPSFVNSPYLKELEPIARIPIDGRYPDILCRTEGNLGSLVSAIEVKPENGDWRKGIGQSAGYRSGAHHCYLAMPGQPQQLEEDAGSVAQELGIGLMALHDGGWIEVIRPRDPRPLPWSVADTDSALSGVPVARRIQLNHPLNYLVIPYLVYQDPECPVMSLLAQYWPDLGSDGTRRHALAGAMGLGLIDVNGGVTIQGETVAELLRAIDFKPETRPNKRKRLAEVAPEIAAVARFVFLNQPATILIRRALLELNGQASLPQLAVKAAELYSPLASALFMSDPIIAPGPKLPGTAWNSSTVFKFKQNLWHVGILQTRVHKSAGSRSTDYLPEQDIWSLGR